MPRVSEVPMQSGGIGRSQTSVAVVGIGYWGKNLVRNFHELGALAALCDAEGSVEERCRREYEGVRFYREFSAVFSDSSISIVVFATTAVPHYPLASAAHEAGNDEFVQY